MRNPRQLSAKDLIKAALGGTGSFLGSTLGQVREGIIQPDAPLPQEPPIIKHRADQEYLDTVYRLSDEAKDYMQAAPGVEKAEASRRLTTEQRDALDSFAPASVLADPELGLMQSEGRSLVNTSEATVAMRIAEGWQDVIRSAVSGGTMLVQHAWPGEQAFERRVADFERMGLTKSSAMYFAWLNDEALEEAAERGFLPSADPEVREEIRRIVHGQPDVLPAGIRGALELGLDVAGLGKLAKIRHAPAVLHKATQEAPDLMESLLKKLDEDPLHKRRPIAEEWDIVGREQEEIPTAPRVPKRPGLKTQREITDAAREESARLDAEARRAEPDLTEPELMKLGERPNDQKRLLEFEAQQEAVETGTEASRIERQYWHGVKVDEVRNAPRKKRAFEENELIELGWKSLDEDAEKFAKGRGETHKPLASVDELEEEARSNWSMVETYKDIQYKLMRGTLTPEDVPKLEALNSLLKQGNDPLQKGGLPTLITDIGGKTTSRETVSLLGIPHLQVTGAKEFSKAVWDEGVVGKAKKELWESLEGFIREQSKQVERDQNVLEVALRSYLNRGNQIKGRHFDNPLKEAQYGELWENILRIADEATANKLRENTNWTKGSKVWKEIEGVISKRGEELDATITGARDEVIKIGDRRKKFEADWLNRGIRTDAENRRIPGPQYVSETDLILAAHIRGYWRPRAKAVADWARISVQQARKVHRDWSSNATLIGELATLRRSGVAGASMAARRIEMASDILKSWYRDASRDIFDKEAMGKQVEALRGALDEADEIVTPDLSVSKSLGNIRELVEKLPDKDDMSIAIKDLLRGISLRTSEEWSEKVSGHRSALKALDDITEILRDTASGVSRFTDEAVEGGAKMSKASEKEIIRQLRTHPVSKKNLRLAMRTWHTIMQDNTPSEEGIELFQRVFGRDVGRALDEAADSRLTGKRGLEQALRRQREVGFTRAGELKRLDVQTITRTQREALEKIIDDSGATADAKRNARSGLDKILDEVEEGVHQDRERVEKVFRMKSKKEKQPTPQELLALGHLLEYSDGGTDIMQALRANRTIGRKIGENIMDLLSVPKVLKAAFDWSALLRQGSLFALREPTKAKNAFVAGAKATFSTAAEETIDNEMRNDPDFQRFTNATLAITEKMSPGKANAAEESFVSHIATQLPVIGAGVRASERAYRITLNKLRYDSMKGIVEGIEQAEGRVLNETELELWAGLVNAATGRSELPEMLQKIGTELTTAFFSPRLQASRIEMARYAMPQWAAHGGMGKRVKYPKDPTITRMNERRVIDAGERFRTTAPGQRRRMTEMVQRARGKSQEEIIASRPERYLSPRREAQKMLFLNIGTRLIGLSLLGMAGKAGIGKMQVEHNPLSPDFGKVRVGRTRLDFSAGLDPWLRFSMNFASGYKKSTQTGKMEGAAWGWGSLDTRAQYAVQFARSKLAPTFGMLWDAAAGQDILGNKNDFVTASGRAQEGMDLMLPFVVDDFMTVLEQEGFVDAVGATAAGFLGAGVASYASMDEVALEHEGVPYKDLSPYAQKRVEVYFAFNMDKPYDSSLQGEEDQGEESMLRGEVTEKVLEEVGERTQKEIIEMLRERIQDSQRGKFLGIKNRQGGLSGELRDIDDETIVQLRMLSILQARGDIRSDDIDFTYDEIMDSHHIRRDQAIKGEMGISDYKPDPSLNESDPLKKALLEYYEARHSIQIARDVVDFDAIEEFLKNKEKDSPSQGGWTSAQQMYVHANRNLHVLLIPSILHLGLGRDRKKSLQKSVDARVFIDDLKARGIPLEEGGKNWTGKQKRVTTSVAAKFTTPVQTGEDSYLAMVRAMMN